jgi:RNA polymerase sigma factor (sigma-70 family)
MATNKNNIASTLIPQSNYRKYSNKQLNHLNTDIPPIGKTPPEKKQIIEEIKHMIILIHEVVIKRSHSGNTLQKKITQALFQTTKEPVPINHHDIWKIIQAPILNVIKVHYLNHHIESFLLAYEQQLGFLINKYKRHLPQHVSYVEGDDLKTIAQLELIETFKAWNPTKNKDIWPLAYTRINGAMKDHIRYISKSDPTRFYDWVTDAANLYLAINDDNSHESEIENSSELNRALKELNEKERKIVTMYINEDLTFSEISKRIKLSESQISRIYKQAIKKIKSILN